MKIAFRADASISIGSGHVMRCLTLADALHARGAEIRFVCRELEGNLCSLIEEKGFQVSRLQGAARDFFWEKDAEETTCSLSDWGKADWLIVDHYLIDFKWESTLRKAAKKIMVIDDLANRSHDCDLLLDQNLYDKMAGRYEGLLPLDAKTLLGPEYALLRAEFRKARCSLRKRDGRIGCILVFFGGSDPENGTAGALEGIRGSPYSGTRLDVVVGKSNPHLDEIRLLCASLPNAAFHCQVNNMAELTASADLCVGAGGSAAWERCCLGLPTLTVIMADNQAGPTQALARYGATLNLGRAENLAPEDYASALSEIESKQLIDMEKKGLALVDGNGCLRVAEAMTEERAPWQA